MSITVEDLLRREQNVLDASKKRREAIMENRKALIESARSSGREFLYAEESTKLSDLKTQLETANREVETARKRVSEAQVIWDEEQGVLEDSRTVDRSKHNDPPSGKPRYDQVGRVTYEARTYNPGNDPNGRGFLVDAARSFLFNDRASTQRIDRHMEEERVERPQYLERAVGTVGFSGLVVPAYLTEQYAPAVANMRPLANVCNRHPLPPDGMSVNISRITGPSSAALQSSENSAVSETNMDDTLLTVGVQTAASQQTVSRQAIERGTGVDDVVMQDMLKRVATVLDSTMINQTTYGIDITAQVTTYTSASPNAAECWPYLFKANSLLEQSLLGVAGVDYVLMHPRRWNWLASQVGSTWPFLGPQGSGVAPQQGALQVTNKYGANVRGVLSNGLKVCVDANVPTTENSNQDPIFLIASDEIHLWEDPNAPVMLRCEQPAAATLSVLFVTYSYFAFTAQRYSNNPGKIVGTGCAAPAGF